MTIYINLTGQSSTDLAGVLNDIIDEFDLTDTDHATIIRLLDEYHIRYEA